MMKRSMMIACIALPLLAGTVAAEEYFKWVDENGVTRYAAKPPAGVNAEKINTHAGSTSKYDPTAANAATEEARKEQAHKDELTAKARQKEEEAKAQCQKIRDNVKVLKERARVKVKSDDGSERYLTPEEQAEKIITLEKYLKENCATQ